MRINPNIRLDASFQREVRVLTLKNDTLVLLLELQRDAQSTNEALAYEPAIRELTNYLYNLYYC